MMETTVSCSQMLRKTMLTEGDSIPQMERGESGPNRVRYCASSSSRKYSTHFVRQCVQRWSYGGAPHRSSTLGYSYSRRSRQSAMGVIDVGSSSINREP